jgi:hypothetical protein
MRRVVSSNSSSTVKRRGISLGHQGGHDRHRADIEVQLPDHGLESGVGRGEVREIERKKIGAIGSGPYRLAAGSTSA